MDNEFRIQYLSVKWTQQSAGRLKDILEKIIDKEVDSLRFYYLGNNYKNKVEHIGAHPGFDVTETLIL